jgi:hypothetical protein
VAFRGLGPGIANGDEGFHIHCFHIHSTPASEIDTLLSIRLIQKGDE